MCGQMDGELTMAAFDWYLEQAGEGISSIIKLLVNKISIRNKRQIMTRYFKWLTESNRPKHIIVGFLIGLAFGITEGLHIRSGSQTDEIRSACPLLSQCWR